MKTKNQSFCPAHRKLPLSILTQHQCHQLQAVGSQICCYFFAFLSLKSNTERTNSLTICVGCLCVYVCLSYDICVWSILLIWFEKDFTHERSFKMSICLWRIILRWPCAVDRCSNPITTYLTWTLPLICIWWKQIVCLHIFMHGHCQQEKKGQTCIRSVHQYVRRLFHKTCVHRQQIFEEKKNTRMGKHFGYSHSKQDLPFIVTLE